MNNKKLKIQKQIYAHVCKWKVETWSQKLQNVNHKQKNSSENQKLFNEYLILRQKVEG